MREDEVWYSERVGVDDEVNKSSASKCTTPDCCQDYYTRLAIVTDVLEDYPVLRCPPDQWTVLSSHKRSYETSETGCLWSGDWVNLCGLTGKIGSNTLFVTRVSLFTAIDIVTVLQ